ncbi:MAG: hypothetical protein ACU0D1_19565 [Pseudooceanicola nanhaiensis]
MPSPIYPPARDGDIAVREEFATARSAGTAEALRLFIARHGDHPLAAEARDRLAACFPQSGGTALPGCDTSGQN